MAATDLLQKQVELLRTAMRKDGSVFSDKAVHRVLRSAHIANPEGRLFPQPEDAHDYAPFFDAIKSTGYDGRISVEAGAPKNLPLDEAAKRCAEFLRKFL